MEFNKKKVTDFLSNNAIVILLVLLVLFVGFTRKGFFSGPNYSNIITNVTPRFIIALGVSGCLITKGTDLSAGRMVGFGGVIACTLLQRPDYTAKFFENLPQMPLVVVLLIVMLITAFFGLLNGCVVAYLKVPPFLATLGMQTIVYGINLVYSGADPIGGLRSDFTGVATNAIFTVGKFSFKWLFLIAIAAGLIFWFLYNKTRYGKYMYAIGGNENAAEVSGVNVNRSKLKIYTLAGLMYG
ncbi:MAG: ABC transporter permease subunit, partial [Holdemania filiformis]